MLALIAAHTVTTGTEIGVRTRSYVTEIEQLML